MKPAVDQRVAEVLAAYPEKARKKLLALRRLVLDTAAATDGVGAITETLKWGQPSYLPAASRSGTTIRMGWSATDPTHYRMFVHCQTDLVHTYRLLFPVFEDELRFEDNRAIVCDVSKPLPRRALTVCIEAALTYHLDRRKTTRKK